MRISDWSSDVCSSDLIAGIDGVVEQVRVFQTLIRTFENHEVILPNSQITSVPIINFTARAQRRIDVAVGISYDADVRQARKVLLDLANAHAKVQIGRAHV